MSKSEAPLWRKVVAGGLITVGGLTVADRIPGVNPWNLLPGKDKLEKLRPQVVETTPSFEFLRSSMEGIGNIEVANANYTLLIEDLEKRVKVLGVELPTWIAGEKAEGTLQMWAQTRTDFTDIPAEAFAANVNTRELIITIPQLEVGDVGIYGPEDPNAPSGEKTDIAHRRGLLNGNLPDMIDEQKINGRALEALRTVASGDEGFLNFSVQQATLGFENHANNLLRSTGNNNWRVIVRINEVVRAENPNISLGEKIEMVVGKRNEKAKVRLVNNGLPQSTKELRELARGNINSHVNQAPDQRTQARAGN